MLTTTIINEILSEIKSNPAKYLHRSDRREIYHYDLNDFSSWIYEDLDWDVEYFKGYERYSSYRYHIEYNNITLMNIIL
jgi:hypothetical protein